MSAGAALVGAAVEGQGPRWAESIGLVVMVEWKSEKRDVSEGKVRWLEHKRLCGKIRAAV